MSDKDKGKRFEGQNKVATPRFRLSFPHLFERDSFDGKFSCSMLFDKETTDLSELEKLVKEQIKERWADKTPNNLVLPFQDGDESQYEGNAGQMIIKAKTDRKPRVFGMDGDENVDEEDFYAGCYCRATVKAVAYDVNGKKGITFVLLGIRKVANGTPFGGTSTSGEDFEGFDDYDDEVPDMGL